MNRIRKLAAQMLKDPQRLWKLIRASTRLSDHKKLGREFMEQVKLLIDMLKCHLTGEYTALSRQSVALLVFALVYFIVPVDMVPDLLPVGLVDDASVILGVYHSLSTDIITFRQWKGATKAGVA